MTRHVIGRTAPIRLYEGVWTDGTLASDPDRFKVAHTYDGRVGVTEDEPGKDRIFGLIWGWSLSYEVDPPELTHMSYYLDKYFQPAEIIARMREEGQMSIFLFNAGGMGMSALWAEVDDMERAFQELGLL
jgi:hypothetical protein